jgi:hypothetical protein
MSTDRDIPIDHRLEVMNWAIVVIPVTALAVLYSVFFALETRGGRSDLGHFPVFSDMLDFAPEYRIFSVMMSVQCVLVGILFWVRDRTLNLIASIANQQFSFRYRLFRYFLIASVIVLSSGSFVMSVVPLQSSASANEVGVHLFVFGGIAYAIGSDLVIGFLRKPVSFLSKLLTGAATALSLVHLILRYWVPFEVDSDHRRVIWSATSSFHILGMIAMEIKLCWVGFDLPKHAIRMVRYDD